MNNCCTFKATFSEGERLNANFSESQQLRANFGEVTIVEHGYDPYQGPYEVTPKAWKGQVLQTNGKNMEDDVTVYEVPYDEVSNQYGTTVTIAS